MKFPRTFLLAFVAASLLLFTCTWLPRFLEFAVMIGIIAFFFGGFAALAVQVGSEFTGRRNMKIAGLAFVGFILFVAALGWTFDILPYIWNGIAVMLLGLAVLLLGGCLAWQCGRDYVGMFLRRKPLAGPANWQVLEAGELPPTDGQKAKDRFRNSYGIKIVAKPRLGALGATTQPLSMDE